jgi:hypothetical protein
MWASGMVSATKGEKISGWQRESGWAGKVTEWLKRGASERVNARVSESLVWLSEQLSYSGRPWRTRWKGRVYEWTDWTSRSVVWVLDWASERPSKRVSQWLDASFREWQWRKRLSASILLRKQRANRLAVSKSIYQTEMIIEVSDAAGYRRNFCLMPIHCTALSFHRRASWDWKDKRNKCRDSWLKTSSTYVPQVFGCLEHSLTRRNKLFEPYITWGAS